MNIYGDLKLRSLLALWRRCDGAVPDGNPMLTGERIYNLEKLFNYREKVKIVTKLPHWSAHSKQDMD